MGKVGVAGEEWFCCEYPLIELPVRCPSPGVSRQWKPAVTAGHLHWGVISEWSGSQEVAESTSESRDPDFEQRVENTAPLVRQEVAPSLFSRTPAQRSVWLSLSQLCTNSSFPCIARMCAYL